jgi:hypothetical protein
MNDSAGRAVPNIWYDSERRCEAVGMIRCIAGFAEKD